jgi:hypothetical protein
LVPGRRRRAGKTAFVLPAFLGHVDLGSTQIYLDMIPELLEQVHLRFESHCGNQLFNQGGRYHEKR